MVFIYSCYITSECVLIRNVIIVSFDKSLLPCNLYLLILFLLVSMVSMLVLRTMGAYTYLLVHLSQMQRIHEFNKVISV